MAAKESFTGHRRVKKTRWTVRLSDVLSKYLITVGGLGTIIAVSTVFLFLLWVVAPLLTRATIHEDERHELTESTARPLHMAMGEYRLLSWILYEDGQLVCSAADVSKYAQWG